MSPRLPAWPMATITVCTLAYTVWALLGAATDHWTPLLSNLLVAPIFFLSALVSFQAAALPRAVAARTWRWLGYGLLAWGLGTLVYAAYHLLNLSPFPSLADVGYLLTLVCFAVGLSALPRERQDILYTLSLLTDAVLVTLMIGDFLWTTSIRAALADTSQSILATWLSLSYPIADLVLYAATFTLVLWRPMQLQRRVVALLSAGLLGFLNADVMFFTLVARKTYYPGVMLNLTWALAALLMAWAAYYSSQTPAPAMRHSAPLPRDWWQRLAPHYVTLGIFVVYLNSHVHAPMDGLQQMLFWVIVSLLIVRQLLVLTDNQRLQFQLTHRAEHDPLTGVRNRHDLEANLQRQIDDARNWNSVVTVLFVDLDRMKQVNDTFGHLVGDRLLQQLSARLSSNLPAGIAVARFGGDEFVVVLPRHDPAAAADLAGRLLTAISEPFPVGQELLQVSASIGVALAPGDAETALEVIEQADTAMYRAKQAGKGTWRFADERLNGLYMPQAQLELLLRGALGRGEFAMHFQPLVDLDSGQIRSFEALMRWTSPVLGAVSPADFIPVAEAREMMGGLGHWAMIESIRQMCDWQARLPDVGVAVNISATQFAHADFVTDICAALSAAGCAPHLLTLELTESAVLIDVPQARQRMRELRALGVRVALDDFGTGYSSLGQLHSLPVDVLKIDRVFVQDLPNATTFIRAMTAMGHSLGLTVVAEGIEDPATVTWLQALGCDLGQGFYFAPPQPAEQAVAGAIRVGSRLLMPPPP